MNIRSLFLPCLLAMIAGAQGQKPSNPMPAYLAEKTKLEETLNTQTEAFTKTVEAEEKAERLKPDEAQEQRLRLITLQRPIGVPGANSARLAAMKERASTTNEAVRKAWEAVLATTQASASLQEKMTTEVTAYALAIWQEAKTAEELVPVIEAAAKQPSPHSPVEVSLISFLKASQRFIEALAIGDVSITAEAWRNMTQLGSRGPSPSSISLADMEKWKARFELAIGSDVKTLNHLLSEAIVAGAPNAEWLAFAEKIDAQNAKLRAIPNRKAPPTFGGGARDTVARKIGAFLSAVERHEAGAIDQALASLSSEIEALSPPAQAAIKEKRTTALARQMAGENERRLALEKQIRERLAKVADAASVIALIEELRSEVAVDRNSVRNVPISLLENDLRQIAALWNEDNFAFAGRENFRQGTPQHPWAKEVTALRGKAIRDGLARVTKAPELLQPPLADLAPDAAIRQLAGDIFRRQEWARLHELLLVSGAWQRDGLQPRNGDELRAVRSLLTGQNFERAEQFADAVQAYRAVLTSIGELVPIDAAAARLKVLKQEHPDAFTKVPPGAAEAPFNVDR